MECASRGRSRCPRNRGNSSSPLGDEVEYVLLDMTARAPEPRRPGQDYEAHGDGYVSQRQTDPRIAFDGQALAVEPCDLPNAGVGSSVAEGAVGAPLVVVTHPVWQ